VVANGDLRVPEDLSHCAAQSCCHAFMIGRAAMARPDLFAVIRGARQDVPLPLAELADIVRDYHAAMRDDGLEPGRAVARVKQWLRLAAQLDPRVEPHFHATKTAAAWPPIAAHLAGMADA
jgi:tRNA-dihydrouridine synthase C